MRLTDERHHKAIRERAREVTIIRREEVPWLLEAKNPTAKSRRDFEGDAGGQIEVREGMNSAKVVRLHGVPFLGRSIPEVAQNLQTGTGEVKMGQDCQPTLKSSPGC